MATWQLKDAKARLSELVRLAEREGPQKVTLHGRPAAVVLSAAEYDRLSGPKPSFVDFMQASPLAGVDLELERDRSPAREIDL